MSWHFILGYIKRKYFCSDDHAIEFAMKFADVGYTFKHGKPQPHWTYIKPKEK